MKLYSYKSIRVLTGVLLAVVLTYIPFAALVVSVNIASIALFVTLLNFMLTYHIVAPWRSTDIGQNVMAWAGLSAALLGLRMVALVRGTLPTAAGTSHVEMIIRFLMFSGFAAVVVWRQTLLLRAQMTATKHRQG